MKRLSFVLALLLLVQLLAAGVKVISSDANQIILEYRLGEYSLSEVESFAHISTSGMNYDAVSGSPLIPYEEIKVGIPPGGSARVTVLSSDSRSMQLSKRLAPVPIMEMQDDISTSRYSIDEALYRPSLPELIQQLESTSFRGLNILPLQIRPFQYDGNRLLSITSQALIRIDIIGNTTLRNEPQRDDLVDAMLGMTVNPQQARYWHQHNRNPVNFASFSSADNWLKLETNQEGIHRITHAQLSSLPLSDIDPRTFRLFSTGGTLLPFQIVTPGAEFHEVPITVVGEEDGSFNTADYILFWGTTRDGVEKNQSLQALPTQYNPYSGNTVYWLTFGGEWANPPRRIATLSSATSSQNDTGTHLAQQRFETETHRREQIGFDWYSSRLFGTTTAEYQFTMNLAEVDTSKTQLLSIMLQQEIVNFNYWHYVEVYVNDTPVVSNASSGSITFSWSGTGEYLLQRNVKSFVSGANVIRIKVIRTRTDNLYLNYIAVDYTQKLNVGSTQLSINPDALTIGQSTRYNLTGDPTGIEVYRVNAINDVARVPINTVAGGFNFIASAVSGGKFFVAKAGNYLSPLSFATISPTDLTASPVQVDNIIITADEFATQAQTLVTLYAERHGLRSIVVKQSDIFNQFNGGHPDPAAIRQYLRYVYHNFPSPRITSVTLIGLGTIDWRNFSNQAASRNKLIVYQRTQLSSDDYFVMMTSSLYPELSVGRYPVRSSNELNNMISNFERYTRYDTGGWWRNSMVFLGDDLFNGSATSYENIHTRQVESAEKKVHPSVLVDKIFAWEYEYDEFQNKPAAREDMLSAINDGRLVWYYIGHGSFDKMGAEDYFNGATDMGRFTNANRLNFMMSASCKISQYDYWGFESLGQKLVMMNNLGSIASYSATRLSAPYSNGPMMEFLLDNLANKRNPLGLSIMSAKISYTQSNDNDAVYVLLGDPTLRVTPPVRDSVLSIDGYAAGSPAQLASRQTVQFNGSLSPHTGSGVADVRVFDADTSYSLDWQTVVSHRGNTLFKGSASVSGGTYSSAFIVPDDVTVGNTASIISYMWDAEAKRDYVNYYFPMSLSDQAVSASNDGPPSIQLFLGSMDFRAGDTVSTNTTLYARVTDSNGINVTGSAGRNILLVIDNSIQPIPVTQYFSYDRDSYTSGLLAYPLSNLSEGPHTVQLIAFDNFNLPSVASTNFIAKKTSPLSIERLLIYPNPMAKDGHITFILSQDSDLEIGIFTVTGKRIRNIKTPGRQGFNQIYWDGRDESGNRPANNTYFVKVTARSGKLSTEARERLVIYK